MRQKIPITVAHGDGIGPEIMEASPHIIEEASAALEIEIIEIGEKIYLRATPRGSIRAFVVDGFRCRYRPASGAVTHAQISAPYEKVIAAGYDIVKTETLRTFDGQQGFTLAQGQ